MLKKTPPVTVIPGVPSVSAREPSINCTYLMSLNAWQNSTARYYYTPTPIAPIGAGYWVYVPSNPLYYVSETRTFSNTAPSSQYTCASGSYLAPDPSFPGGSKMVTETRCYWNY